MSEGLRIGDEVFIESGYSYTTLSRHTVSRVLKASVELGDGGKFWKINGARVGATSGSTPQKMLIPTPELIQRFLRQELLARLKGYDWNKLTTVDLGSVGLIMDYAEKKIIDTKGTP